MSEAPAAPAANRLKSTPGVNWAAGLVAAIVLGHILGLITVAITNEWLLWIALGFTGLILAGVVGFVVRLTSAGGNAFLPAFVGGGLGAHAIATLAGSGFDYLGDALLAVYQWNPLSAYAVFVGVLVGVVATVARKV